MRSWNLLNNSKISFKPARTPTTATRARKKTIVVLLISGGRIGWTNWLNAQTMSVRMKMRQAARANRRSMGMRPSQKSFEIICHLRKLLVQKHGGEQEHHLAIAADL